MRHTKMCALICLLLALASNAAARSTSGTPLEQQQQEQEPWVATHGPITNLPGYEGQLPSKHYGGYISVGNKQLYYYMVESERSPATDPVV